MINSKDLMDLGYVQGPAFGIALKTATSAFEKLRGFTHEQARELVLEKLSQVLEYPESYKDHILWGDLAIKLLPPEKPDNVFDLIEKKPYTVYGGDNIETGAFEQMDTAMMLPVSVYGSLMPDAHQGYGLPIGGVLATDNAVIPYGVGVDIGCRMAMTVYEVEWSTLSGQHNKMLKALGDCTVFGTGGEHNKFIGHDVLDSPDWLATQFLKGLHDKGVRQLGTSGSGNHFVEFGVTDIFSDKRYVAILSHSGSRGVGAKIANHYTKIALDKCKLPTIAKHLAWLNLDTEEGQEYWLSMNLAGEFAKACHDQIHERLAKYMGWKPVLKIENHHNFAWKEVHMGRELIVHRKGATPAGKGVLGIIPGSMATKGFIVEGIGNTDSLNSASHGAGRAMSRTAACNTFEKTEMSDVLEKAGVILMGGNVDESPMAYKDIHKVMSVQKDLVRILGTFEPKIVRMDNEKD
jgi:tRNA-splicing ligase RtcB (3'-phosphate/5'-hydroxy nucleic acid ligase)